MTENMATLALVLTAIGLLITAFGLNRNLRNRDDDRFTSQEKLLRAEIAAAGAVESRARHDLAALMEKQLARLELAHRDLDRVAMRRDDFEKVEKRWDARFDKIEGKLDEALRSLPRTHAAE